MLNEHHLERSTAGTAYEIGFLDALDDRVSAEYIYQRTQREHDDYVAGFRVGRLSRVKYIVDGKRLIDDTPKRRCAAVTPDLFSVRNWGEETQMYHSNKCTPNYIGSDPALKIDMDWTWPESERSCRHCVHVDVNSNGYNPKQPLCLYFKEYNKTHPDLKYDYTRGFETDWNATCRFFQPREQS